MVDKSDVAKSDSKMNRLSKKLYFLLWFYFTSLAKYFFRVTKNKKRDNFSEKNIFYRSF